jgi:hypothetical protein
MSDHQVLAQNTEPTRQAGRRRWSARECPTTTGGMQHDPGAGCDRCAHLAAIAVPTEGARATLAAVGIWSSRWGTHRGTSSCRPPIYRSPTTRGSRWSLTVQGLCPSPPRGPDPGPAPQWSACRVVDHPGSASAAKLIGASPRTSECRTKLGSCRCRLPSGSAAAIEAPPDPVGVSASKVRPERVPWIPRSAACTLDLMVGGVGRATSPEVLRVDQYCGSDHPPLPVHR